MGGVVGAGWQWGGGFGGVVGGGQVRWVSGSVVGACLEMERLPVVRVEAGWRQGVRDGARVRALGCVEASGWALGERYRVEPVFGRLKGVYGSSVGCRSWGSARVWVWGLLVLWELVQWLRVWGDGGGDFVSCVGFVKDRGAGNGIFEHPQDVMGQHIVDSRQTHTRPF